MLDKAVFKYKVVLSLFSLCLLVSCIKEGNNSNTTTSNNHNYSEYGEVYNQLPDDVLAPLAIGVSSLKTTFEIKDGLPYQNGIVYPSFTPQDSLDIDLTGKWFKMRINQIENFNMTFEGRSKDLIKRFEGESKGLISGDFNQSTASTIDLPSPENRLYKIVAPNGVEKYEGGAWYYKEFTLKDIKQDNFILKSLGSNYVTDVFVNHKYVGYHEGGHSPFAFDVTKYVVTGKNYITLRVHGIPFGSRSDTIPGDIEGTDYFNYTGPYQLFYIERLPSIYVSRVDVLTKDALDGIDFKVVITNNSENDANKEISYRIYETDQSKYKISPSAKSIIKNLVYDNSRLINLNKNQVKIVNESILIENPKLWSTFNPNLYVIEVAIDGVSHYTQFGLRTIKAVGTHLYLNNVDTFFAGVARHEESLNFGRTFDLETVIKDLEGINDLKASLVRTGHYPNQIYTYILLDRYGLASMVELPLWQNDEDSYKRIIMRGIGLQLWREMIFSNFNSPSVLFWSTQNETVYSNLRQTFNQALKQDVISNYPDGRIITQSAAADRPTFQDNSTKPLDAAGYTLYFETFHGDVAYGGTKKYLEKTRTFEGSKDKPALATEYGYWQDSERIFKTLQAILEFATVNKDGTSNEEGYMAVAVYWTYADWYVNHQQHLQGMGLVSLDRKPKTLYYKLQAIYQDLMLLNGQKVESAIKKENKILYQGSSLNSTIALILDVNDFSEYNYLVFNSKNDMLNRNFSLKLEGKSSFIYTVDTVFKKVKVPTSFFVRYLNENGNNQLVINLDLDIALNLNNISFED